MSAEKDRSLQMLSSALEMEKKGKDFYNKAVSKCQNILGQEIFRMLLKDETVHMNRILKIYKSLKEGKPWSGEWKSLKMEHEDIKSLFKRMATEHGPKIMAETSDLDALDIGIDLESRAISFYERELKKSTNSLEKAFIEQMIEEEQGHHTALVDMKLYLSDSASWFLEHEHTGLDGA